MRKAVACMWALVAALIAPACAERPASNAPAAGAGVPAAAAPSGASAVAGALEFVADDAPRALAEAKRRGVPVFVEAWAPW